MLKKIKSPIFEISSKNLLMQMYHICIFSFYECICMIGCVCVYVCVYLCILRLLIQKVKVRHTSSKNISEMETDRFAFTRTIKSINALAPCISTFAHRSFHLLIVKFMHISIPNIIEMMNEKLLLLPQIRKHHMFFRFAYLHLTRGQS